MISTPTTTKAIFPSILPSVCLSHSHPPAFNHHCQCHHLSYASMAANIFACIACINRAILLSQLPPKSDPRLSLSRHLRCLKDHCQRCTGPSPLQGSASHSCITPVHHPLLSPLCNSPHRPQPHLPETPHCPCCQPHDFSIFLRQHTSGAPAEACSQVCCYTTQ